MNSSAVRAWTENLARLKSVSQKPWFYPVALLLIGLIAYAYQIGALGFYWDDWEVVFLLNARSTSLLYGYFAFDRPFAWPYQVMYSVFGLSPIAWHLVTLLLRWAGVLLFYLSLTAIWPRLDGYLRWLGALELVYPGFFMQSISTALNRHFMAFFLFMLSVYLMVLAVRHPKRAWFLFPLSWVAALVQIFTIEYFVGLELIRPVILWMLLMQEPGAEPWKTARRTAMLWLPYLVVFGVYAWWRLVLFPASIARLNYAGDFKLLGDFQGSFIGGVLTLFTRVIFDLIYSTIQVWITGFTGQEGFTLQSKAVWFALGVGIVVAGLFALFQDVERRGDDAERQGPRPVAVLGACAFVVSGLIVWLTSKQLSGGGRWDDRFSLAMMFGASLLTLAGILWLIRVQQRKLLLTAMLIFAVATQVLVVNRYRLDWETQRDYYWQLAWRAPALQPQTAIISFEQPSASIPGYDASFALNVLYNGRIVNGATPYWFFTNDRFLNFKLLPGRSISYDDRNLKFTGNTSESIAVLRQGSDRCLQVLDAAYTNEPFYEADESQLIPISNVGRIRAEAGQDPPNPQVFGSEPDHDWCYYFEKADLARQLGQWSSVLELEKQAKAQGLAPGFGPEYVPFIEAHARSGDWQKALELSQAADITTAEMKPLLCFTWDRLGKLPGANGSAVEKARQTFSCTTP
jgi:hypothetical protein